MANNFNTINEAAGVLVRAGAEIVSEMCPFFRDIDKVDASEWGGKNGYKSGDTIYVPKPAQFKTPLTSSFDVTSSKADIIEERVPCTADIIIPHACEIDSLEGATEFDLKQMVKRYVEPAAEAIAQNFEAELVKRATQATANTVGTAGSTAFTVDDVLSAKELLSINLTPMANRTMLMDASAARKAVDARKALFTTNEKTAREGAIGMADGFTWKESQLIYRHTMGSDVTGVAVDDAAVATGATTLAVDGLDNTTGTVKKGTVFTIAGVYRVHPVTKVTLPELQQFVVTADATANGSGDATLAISPTIHGPLATGARQNVSALPANNAAIVFVGEASKTYTQTLTCHKQAFRACTLPLMMPTNAEFAAQHTTKQGVTLALVRDFDVNTRTMVTRLDLLGAFVAIRPEFACRITS